jgi:hypothetical protein
VITGVIWLLYTVDILYLSGKPMQDLLPSKLLLVKKLNSGVYVLNFIRSFLYLLSGIITILERRMLIRELHESPLLNIDETLNEELYKNILLQSKNPDDEGLVKEYRRLTLQTLKNKSDKVDDSSASSLNKSSSINNPNNFNSNSLTGKKGK